MFYWGDWGARNKLDSNHYEEMLRRAQAIAPIGKTFEYVGIRMVCVAHKYYVGDDIGTVTCIKAHYANVRGELCEHMFMPVEFDALEVAIKNA